MNCPRCTFLGGDPRALTFGAVPWGHKGGPNRRAVGGAAPPNNRLKLTVSERDPGTPQIGLSGRLIYFEELRDYG